MRFSDHQESSESDCNYKIGYGKPPKHSRFQPGYSGNPRGKPAGAQHPATILRRTLLEFVVVKHQGRETKTSKLKVFIAQIINQAMRADYYSVLLLFRYAGLGFKLSEATREQGGGIPGEAADLIRRALLGEDIETETLRIEKPRGEPSSLSGHVSDQPQLKQSAEGQVKRVGYGNPPVHSRFQKGHSGNPLGRPRISKDFAAITRRMLLEQVVIVEGGRKQTLSRQDIVLKQIVNKAVGGNRRFQALLLKYVPLMDLVLRRRPVPPRVALERIRRSLLSAD